MSLLLQVPAARQVAEPPGQGQEAVLLALAAPEAVPAVLLQALERAAEPLEAGRASHSPERRQPY